MAEFAIYPRRLLAVNALACLLTAGAGLAASTVVTGKLGAGSTGVFEKEILPVRERSCIVCRGPEKATGRLRLDKRAAALARGRSGHAANARG
jgi:hypothetical protein